MRVFLLIHTPPPCVPSTLALVYVVCQSPLPFSALKFEAPAL